MAIASMQVETGVRSCAEECARCADLCAETVTHCLELGGRYAEAVHINLLLDCAEICRTNISFLRHGSARYRLTSHVCAEVCRACAEDCSRIAHGNAMMRNCAEQCSRCAESCDGMAA